MQTAQQILENKETIELSNKKQTHTKKTYQLFKTPQKKNKKNTMMAQIKKHQKKHEKHETHPLKNNETTITPKPVAELSPNLMRLKSWQGDVLM